MLRSLLLPKAPLRICASRKPIDPHRGTCAFFWTWVALTVIATIVCSVLVYQHVHAKVQADKHRTETERAQCNAAVYPYCSYNPAPLPGCFEKRLPPPLNSTCEYSRDLSRGYHYVDPSIDYLGIAMVVMGGIVMVTLGFAVSGFVFPWLKRRKDKFEYERVADQLELDEENPEPKPEVKN